ncbi:MAG: hypothetical protein AB2531_15565, partial [Candidatus Thiodiazotropha sp.]
MKAKPLAYAEKLETLLKRSGIDRLEYGQQQFLRQQCLDYRFTQQELQQLSDIAVDLAMWGERPLDQVWPDAESGNLNPKQRRQRLLGRLSAHWRQLKQGPKRYPRLPLRVAPELQRITRI